METEDCHQDSFQRQALEVREPDKNFNPMSIPQNGDEFLTHMMYERKRCPAVISRRPKSDIKKSCTYANAYASSWEKEKESYSSECLNNQLSTTEWREAQIADFKETREQIAEMRKPETQIDSSSDILPQVKDADEWENFCRNNPPLLRILVGINQRMLEALLEFFPEWLCAAVELLPDEEPTSGSSSSSATITASGISSCATDLTGSDTWWIGSWLYATLACLQLPLEPAVHNTLREVARTCIRVRSRLQMHELQKTIPYNLFICLIAKVFDQMDFIDYI